jgi:hypothetical protein
MCSHRFAPVDKNKENEMTRTIFAMAAAALLTLAVSGTSQAAPIAPLSGVATANQSNVTPAYWYHHRHRHCWRGRYGRLHCGW